MQRLEVSGAVRLIYGSLGVKRLTMLPHLKCCIMFDTHDDKCEPWGGKGDEFDDRVFRFEEKRN